MKVTKKQNMKHKIPNKNNGITLIALVITIIVMLILVAVTINMAINGGLFGYAGMAVKETTIAQEKEKIQVGLTKVVIEKATSGEEIAVTKEALENALATGVDEISVSDKRPGDEYSYIITFNGNQYGIRENNEVEYLERGIYNKYIYVTYVNEVTPKYLFEKTVTQEDVDKEVNGSNVSYTIIGVSNAEDGEYQTEGSITGKSGELNIKDLQRANFEYTLTNFFDGDDSFYVKIQIGDSIEKTQKLTIVQGDEVRYEENFNGIVYTGTWENVEDENCSGGSVKYTDEKGSKATFSGLGSAVDCIFLMNESCGGMMYQVKNEQTDSTVKLGQGNYYSEELRYNVPLSEKTGLLWFDGDNHSPIEYNITITDISQRVYIDAIIIYK